MVGDEVPELDEPLGDPRSLVQQGSGVEERPEVDGRNAELGAALGGDQIARGRVGGGHRLVAEELQRTEFGQPDRDVIQVDVDPATAAVPRVARVGGGDDVEEQRDVGEAPRHQADAVQRPAGGDESDRADQTARRLVAGDAVERRRDPAGSCGVGGDGERDLTEGDGEGGPRAGAPGDQVVVVHAVRDAVRTAGAVEAGGELVEVGLADQDRAGVEQADDDRRGRGGDVGVVGAGERGRPAGDVDAVLDGERDPEEREPGLLGGGQGLQLSAPGEQVGLGDHGDPDRVVTAGLDLAQGLEADLGRRRAAGGVRGGEFADPRRRGRSHRSGTDAVSDGVVGDQTHAVDCRPFGFRLGDGGVTAVFRRRPLAQIVQKAALPVLLQRGEIAVEVVAFEGGDEVAVPLDPGRRPEAGGFSP